MGQLGFSVGTLVGGMLDQSLLKQKPQSANRLADLKISGSSYGVMIPMVWGDYALGGNIIDYKTDAAGNFLIETSKKKGSKLTGTQRIYSYSASFAVMVCRGPASIRRIWAQDRTVYDMYANPPSPYTLRIYRGDEQQQPDSLLVAQHGASFTPAYRGICYVVFQDLPLAEWGNALPNLSFEVTQTYPDLVQSQPSLQSYWRFDNEAGKLTDSGPKGFTLTDTATPSAQVTGCFQLLNGASGGGRGIWNGNAAVFLTATTGNVTQFQGPKVTVEAWFRWHGFGGGSQSEIEWFDPVNTMWSFEIEVIRIGANTMVSYDLGTDGVTTTTVHNPQVTRDSLWHHVMVTYNQVGNSVMYLDGAAVSTVAAPLAMAITATASAQVQIRSGEYEWDEVAIYNDTLTAADALDHFREGAGLARTRSSPTVGTFLADIFTQEGLVSSQWDVSAATDPLDGLGVTDRQPARDAADPVLRIYNTLLCEYDGKIVAVKRGGAPVATIAAADLGAVVWSGSNTPTPKVKTKRLQDLELPFRVDVGGFDKFRKYEMSHQGAERYTKTHLQEPLTVQTNLVFAADLTLSAADKMRQAAERLLYQIWTEREQFMFSLPPSYLYLTPGDVVLLPVLGQTLRVRLTQVDVELPGPIHCTAVLDDASVLVQTISGASVISSGEEAADVLTTTLMAWSGNALLDTDADTIGLYVAAGPGTAGYWPGATVYWSTDSGASYQELETITDATTIGTAATVLAAGTVAGAWDTVNTVDVVVASGSAPVSTSDADVIAGSNAALLGDEVIQFATVTALGGSSYRLTRLLRGRRGTDGRWAEHRIGERFALLDSGLVKRETLGNSYLGRPVLVKGVTSGQSINDVTAQTVLIEGAEKKPYAPCQVKGARDGSNNLTISFQRRDRKAGTGLPSPLTIPMSEATEAYNVRIRSGSPKTITAITIAAQAVITSASHGFSVSDVLLFTGVLGMTQINGLVGTVTAVTTNTATVNLSSLYWGAYVSGGTAEKVLRTIAVSTPTASYLAATQTGDGLTPGNPVNVAIFQVGANGDGYGAFAVV